MAKFKISYKLFIILFIFWMLLTNNFSLINIVTGIVVSFFSARVSYGILYDDSGFMFKFPKLLVLLSYSIRLIIEIYKSSFIHIKRIIKKDYHPSIIEVELEVNDPLAITIISNSITLTPGTITIDANKNKLLVLSIKDDGKDGKTISENIKNTYEKFFT